LNQKTKNKKRIIFYGFFLFGKGLFLWIDYSRAVAFLLDWLDLLFSSQAARNCFI